MSLPRKYNRKVEFPDKCPNCNLGTLWFEYVEGETTEANVEYVCDHCGAGYDYRMMSEVMLQRGIADAGKILGMVKY